MACFWKSSECTLTHLPIFVPNDYLYTTHADKGKEKWEIYAWAIRDIMAKVGDFKLHECSSRHHMNYPRILCGMKTFDAPEDQDTKTKEE